MGDHKCAQHIWMDGWEIRGTQPSFFFFGFGDMRGGRCPHLRWVCRDESIFVQGCNFFALQSHQGSRLAMALWLESHPQRLPNGAFSALDERCVQLRIVVLAVSNHLGREGAEHLSRSRRREKSPLVRFAAASCPIAHPRLGLVSRSRPSVTYRPHLGHSCATSNPHLHHISHLERISAMSRRTAKLSASSCSSAEVDGPPVLTTRT